MKQKYTYYSDSKVAIMSWPIALPMELPAVPWSSIVPSDVTLPKVSRNSHVTRLSLSPKC
jgi:hypothetical protein